MTSRTSYQKIIDTRQRDFWPELRNPSMVQFARLFPPAPALAARSASEDGKAGAEGLYVLVTRKVSLTDETQTESGAQK